MPCPLLAMDYLHPRSRGRHRKSPMAYYDKEALYTSLPDRVSYLTSFLQFSESDADTLNEAALILEPHIPESWPDGRGYQSFDSRAEQIKERKRFFSIYVKRLITSDYNDFKTWEYYDKVGKMHTGDAGLKHRKLVGKDGLRVDHIHLSGLLGWTMDRLIVIVSLTCSLSLIPPAHLLVNTDFERRKHPLSKRETIIRSLHKVMGYSKTSFHVIMFATGRIPEAPRAMAGSRIRQRPVTSGTSSPEASVAYPAGAGGDSGSDRRTGAISPTQSSAASVLTSATGADSVAWSPQTGGNTLSETWGRGPISNKSIGQKPSTDWSKGRARDRSMSNLEEIHSQVSNSRPGLWRRIFG
ncbi:Protoglobin [Rhizoctonia solani]|uniref:Protoglobin n=1 Tax=Rhizoctonia solani TaxID=456999 RepID=A0A8H7IAK5_9AGAM|nr:Protoglobin [Rhizoctonia solani]